MSTLSLDPAVSLFEPATRRAPAVPTAAPGTRPPAPRTATSRSRATAGTRPGPQATHARRSYSASAPGVGAVLARAAQLVAVRALGTSVAAAAVTWALMARSSGGPADLATSSLRGLAAAAVLCAAWGFQDRARLGALGATRTWYGAASLLAIAHTAWFATAEPGRPAGQPVPGDRGVHPGRRPRSWYPHCSALGPAGRRGPPPELRPGGDDEGPALSDEGGAFVDPGRGEQVSSSRAPSPSWGRGRPRGPRPTP